MTFASTLVPHALLANSPALWIAKAAPLHFDICQDQTYISIKDQVVKARVLTQWLQSSGFLAQNRGTLEILIIGAGVAGVTAACDLASAGSHVKVTLIDSKKHTFSAQANCKTRWVSVTQYDWPSVHAHMHEFPTSDWDVFDFAATATAKTFPVNTLGKPERASDLAARWQGQFAPYISDGKSIDYKSRCEMIGKPTVNGRMVNVRIKDSSGTVSPLSFHLVISAVGFGQESIPLDPYNTNERISSYFWEDDDLEQPGAVTDQTVGIVGLGDGALQDFIRVSCDPKYKTALCVYDAIGKAIEVELKQKPHWNNHLVKYMALWDDLRQQLQTVDRQAALAVPWAAQPHDVWHAADRDCEKLVNAFVHAHSGFVSLALDSVLRDAATRPKRIVFISEYDAPGKVYMLNRFLYHLIKRCSKSDSRPADAIEIEHEKLAAANPVCAPGGRGNQYQIPNCVVYFDRLIWRAGPKKIKASAVFYKTLRSAIGTTAMPYFPVCRFP